MPGIDIGADKNCSNDLMIQTQCEHYLNGAAVVARTKTPTRIEPNSTRGKRRVADINETALVCQYSTIYPDHPTRRITAHGISVAWFPLIRFWWDGGKSLDL